MCRNAICTSHQSPTHLQYVIAAERQTIHLPKGGITLHASAAVHGICSRGSRMCGVSCRLLGALTFSLSSRTGCRQCFHHRLVAPSTRHTHKFLFCSPYITQESQRALYFGTLLLLHRDLIVCDPPYSLQCLRTRHFSCAAGVFSPFPLVVPRYVEHAPLPCVAVPVPLRPGPRLAFTMRCHHIPCGIAGLTNMGSCPH